ncbi:MAG: hypothetical protein AAB544_06080 [Patescibacteria group bacterium]
MIPLSHPLTKEALLWSSEANESPPLSPAQWCETKDILRARIDSLTIRLLQQNIAEDRVRLFDAVLSEIGSNAFDHNIGQWRDTPGVLFDSKATDDGILCVLADRGQGLHTTLSRVRPALKNDAEALRVAFTESISGRAPEQRGNGLKFVRSILLEDGIDLWYGSGNAAYAVAKRVEEWLPCDPPVLGCTAILLLRNL